MPHLLKRLELNGFKSFASKTVFEFPGGITAIVGPNGSGKSNIIDGIRWILGEREAKNLRGAKTDDLIFNGTPKHPRVSQAQASLYFENQKDFFPLEFSDIVVSRQVSREGENHCFLNKAEVRLKDIIDFFAKSRLGTKGLVVVTQGNSDIFVRSSPPARRLMLEETLGLREYQLKKEGAIRRLKNTRINLDKARALVEEILPHLRSLRRQAGRFEKREILEKELHELEDRFFGSKLEEIRKEEKKLEEENILSRKDREALEQEKKEAEIHLKKIEKDQPEERQEYLKIKKEKEGLLGKKSLLQKELGRLEARLEIGQKVDTTPSSRNEDVLIIFSKIRNWLEAALEKDEKELRETVQKSLEEMNLILVNGRKRNFKEGLLENIQSALQRTENEICLLEKEISVLQDKGNELEKKQEDFYLFYKKAVEWMDKAKEKLEQWETANREKVFAGERLKLRLEEIEKQLIQAGRRKEEIKFSMAKFADVDSGSLERRIFRLRGDLASVGEIDEDLIREAKETEKRYKFLQNEIEDSEKAQSDLKELIGNLDEKIRNEFHSALIKINEEFGKFFRSMFGGGQARLKIEKPKEQTIKVQNTSNLENEAEMIEREKIEEESGIEIELRLPQKKIGSLEVLSGGEKSLVGIAALFSLISVSPPPFLVLDEIDAALDSRNSKRFAEMLKDFSKETQFIVVTHNQAVMEVADVLYGITASEDGTSKAVSLKLG